MTRWDIVGAAVGMLLCGGIVLTLSRLHSSGAAVIAAFAVSYVAAVLLHEFAHAVTGRAGGGVVNEIKLGLTTTPAGKHWSVRFLGFRWEFYAFPRTGSVSVYFTNPHRYRTRAVAMIAAGPLASLAAACAGVGAVAAFGSDPNAAAAGIGWAIANGYFFVGTITPSRRMTGLRVVETDGYRIFKVLSLTDEEIRQNCFSAKVYLDMLKSPLDGLGTEEAITRHDSEPGRIAILFQLVDKLYAANDPRQAGYLDRLLAHPELPPSVAANVLDTHLTRHLAAGTVTADEWFDRSSQRLLELSGHSLTSLGTRGSVLVDLGRIEEGAAILEDVLRRTGSSTDKCFACAFLAIVEKKKGNLTAAAQLARQAKSADPHGSALARISDLLSAA